MAWRDPGNPWAARAGRSPSGRRFDDLEGGHSNTRPTKIPGIDDSNSPVSINGPENSKEVASDAHVMHSELSDRKPRKRGRIPFLHRKGKDEESMHTSTSDSKKAQRTFTLWGQFKATVLRSWINLLLVCVPVGIALNYTNVNRIAVSVVIWPAPSK